MADRLNLQSQLEHLQTKYVGTGHADITKYEWVVNHLRDSYASYLGHPSLISYFALAQNKSIARVRYECLEQMSQPAGKPPSKSPLLPQ